MAKRKLIYLINPISGVKRKDSLYQLIKHRTEAAGFQYEILPTNKEGDYSYLREDIYQQGVTDIIVCGGDGTMSSVTGSLIDQPVAFGIIPMGSGNGLALTAGIPTNAAKALDIIFNGESGAVDGFYINDKFSCMLCGIGFDALVAEKFAGASRRGLKTYIQLAIINFLNARAYDFVIESGALRFNANAFLISIANSNQFGNNFTIAPQASLNDGLLDIVIIKKMNKFLLPFFILRQLTGKNPVRTLDDHVDNRKIMYFQSPELTIYNSSPAPLHIDGDPAKTSDKFTIRVQPNAYRLLHPLA